ncbi:hypothetical protein M569_05213 [Genlisea aurea]|uniref:Uncharacterized protein n=1 Tax=Genlisea aurea TaxID=192259 RepID=S8EAJ8_9LAMI|nr:hypothetical protein M569_05213 [Genlisea aurea]
MVNDKIPILKVTLEEVTNIESVSEVIKRRFKEQLLNDQATVMQKFARVILARFKLREKKEEFNRLNQSEKELAEALAAARDNKGKPEDYAAAVIVAVVDAKKKGLSALKIAAAATELTEDEVNRVAVDGGDNSRLLAKVKEVALKEVEEELERALAAARDNKGKPEDYAAAVIAAVVDAKKKGLSALKIAAVATELTEDEVNRVAVDGGDNSRLLAKVKEVALK